MGLETSHFTLSKAKGILNLILHINNTVLVAPGATTCKIVT
jgi:hypothetical protein